MIRVVLVDDHQMVREGIRALLEQGQNIAVIGEAADGREAVELVQRLKPDVLVIDIAMPRLDGLQAIEKLNSLGVATEVVVLSMYSDSTLVRQALRRGVRGYVLKRSVSEELLVAIRAATKGELFLSPELSTCLGKKSAEPGSECKELEPFQLLTPRERQVLQLIAEGHTNAKIAHALHISVKTVETHRTRLMSKLGVHDVVTLLRFAVKHKLVFIED